MKYITGRVSKRDVKFMLNKYTVEYDNWVLATKEDKPEIYKFAHHPDKELYLTFDASEQLKALAFLSVYDSMINWQYLDAQLFAKSSTLHKIEEIKETMEVFLYENSNR